jgi:hypothetical protein
MPSSNAFLSTCLLFVLFASPVDAGGVATPVAGLDVEERRVWSRQLGSAAADVATGAATDDTGSIVVAGATEGGLNGASQGESDAFLAKLASDGKTLWVRQFGSSSRDAASSTAVDRDGYIVVAGLTFGDLGGENAGEYDAFVAKFDRNGDHQWTRQLGTASGDQAGSVGTDAQGNVYIAGDTFGGLNGASAGLADAYLAKYDPRGDLLWIRQLGSAAGDVITGIAIDQAGHVYATGQTDGDLGGTNAGPSDAFLAKYAANGDLLWTRQAGTAAFDSANAVAIGDEGTVVIGGLTNGDLGGANAGDYDAFLIGYDAEGNSLWTRQFGTAADDVANEVSAGGGNVYVTGYTGGNLGGSNEGGYDAFLAAYDSAGNRTWIDQMGSDADVNARCVAAIDDGSVYIAGQTRGGIDGTNAGAFDVFVAKFADRPSDA